MANADKRKQSLYFPEDMLKEIQHEAQRLDRSLSWIVQQGWKIARDKLKDLHMPRLGRLVRRRVRAAPHRLPGGRMVVIAPVFPYPRHE